MTSHYFSQYASPGYASSAARSPDTTPSPDSPPAHPLFEPDLVNSYAEALLIPSTVNKALLEMVPGEAAGEGCVEKLKKLSKSVFKDFSLGNPSTGNSVKDFVYTSKIKLFSSCIIKVAGRFNVELAEDWGSLAGTVQGI